MGLSEAQLKDVKFVNLRTFSHFSLQLGVGTIKDHLKSCKEKGLAGIAITDNATLAGAIQLNNLAREEGFPFVIGANLFVTDDIYTKDQDNKYQRLIVFAKSWKGYQNLCHLIAIGSLEDHFYYRPRVSYDEIFAHKEGLIVSTSCIASPFGSAILQETGEEERLLERFKAELGQDLVVEISLADNSHRWNKDLKNFVEEENKQEIVNKRMLDLAKKHDLVAYLTMPSYMPDRKFYEVQKILIANSPTGADGWHFHEPQYTMSVSELHERKGQFAPYISDEQFLELCEATNTILTRCSGLELDFKPSLPAIQYEDHAVNKNAQLEAVMLKMERGFRKFDPDFAKLLERSRGDLALRTTLKIIVDNKKVDIFNDQYRKQLTYELNVIQFNGRYRLCDYFLLLEDVSRFVRENGYMRGYGRGSGAGSLVSYALDITDVDPIKFDLLFSRFLTKERIGSFVFEFPEYPKKSG